MAANHRINDGPVGDQIMTACLTAAGIDPTQAAPDAHRGGLYTLEHDGLHIQCIWKPTRAATTTTTSTSAPDQSRELAARSTGVPLYASNVQPARRSNVTRRNQMATTNINRVVLTGNLTQDPELRSTPDGTAVCRLRIASNTRRKDATSGQWTDKPNYFDVTAFGAQGENAARYLTRGRGVAIDGRLDWHEWQTQDGSQRQAVQIIADTVQFLGTPQQPPNDQPHHRARGTAGNPGDDIPF